MQQRCPRVGSTRGSARKFLKFIFVFLKTYALIVVIHKSRVGLCRVYYRLYIFEYRFNNTKDDDAVILENSTFGVIVS